MVIFRPWTHLVRSSGSITVMANDLPIPFSARNRSGKTFIDEDFPQSGRMGLLHLVRELVDKKYVRGWPEVIRELERTGRTEAGSYRNQTEDAYFQDALDLIAEFTWDRVYGFCERLHNYLATEVRYTNGTIKTPVIEVQEYIATGLERLFWEEGLAFDFRDGSVQRRGRKHTVEQVAKAEVVMGDSRLAEARKHYNKALQFFRSPTEPDFENAVKEAVCAVEAAGKGLFPQSKATTLGDLIGWLVKNEDIRLPKALSHTLSGLYGFRSGGTGVGHGGADGGIVTPALAEYVLGLAASQIVLLIDLANASEENIPF